MWISWVQVWLKAARVQSDDINADLVRGTAVLLLMSILDQVFLVESGLEVARM